LKIVLLNWCVSVSVDVTSNHILFCYVSLVYQQAADVLVLLDGSASVKENDFKRVKELVKWLVDSYTISENGVRFSVMEYSDEATVVIPLNRFYDEDQLKAAIENIRASGGTSQTAKALETVVREGFSLENGARPGAPKTLILVTDGSSAGETSLQDAVLPLRKSGIVVHVVSIGKKAKDPDTTSVASGHEYVQTVVGFDDISGIVPGLVQKINENLDKGIMKV
jgi:hypothetical protein